MPTLSLPKRSPSSTRIVVAGTGTGVGKTFVCCELLEALAGQGWRCLGLKPVETGYTDPECSDAALLARAARHPRITPHFSSSAAESPHRAARASGTPIGTFDLATWVAAQSTDAAPDVTLVETAGGLFSPLGEVENNLDLVRVLEPCTFVLVATDRLGALHDVLATVAAARAVHRVPDVICMNLQDEQWSALDNCAELRRFVGSPTVIQAPLLRFSAPPDLARLFSSRHK